MPLIAPHHSPWLSGNRVSTGALYPYPLGERGSALPHQSLSSSRVLTGLSSSRDRHQTYMLETLPEHKRSLLHNAAQGTLKIKEFFQTESLQARAGAGASPALAAQTISAWWCRTSQQAPPNRRSCKPPLPAGSAQALLAPAGRYPSQVDLFRQPVTTHRRRWALPEAR